MLDEDNVYLPPIAPPKKTVLMDMNVDRGERIWIPNKCANI